LTRKFWEDLIGSTVGGSYLLRELAGSTDENAVYLTSYGEESATLRLMSAEEASTEVRSLQHPHLLRLFAHGACDLGGSHLHYSVTEAVDEDLASVIASRALSPDETREMLSPVLEALGYLHDLGFAHWQIKPSNILAKGDTVKLSVDSVRPAGAVASPEEDMRALGLTIIEVLTQERQPSAIAELPQPFRDIVEHLLQFDPALRWTARQAAMRLSGTVPDTAVPFVAPVAGGAREGRKAIPRWVYPAAAVLLLAAALFALARITGSSSGSSMAASAAAPAAPAPVVPAPVVPAPVMVDPGVRPRQDVQPQPPAKPAGHGWFVVVASYTREVDAEGKARDLGRRFPEFKPSVFPPSAIDMHYVVIIGSGLTEEKAESLRQRAVASGMPPDTYIKKYPSPRP
jgi:cell division septation protein DedD